MESLLFLTNWQSFLSLPLSYFLCGFYFCPFTVVFLSVFPPPLSHWFFHTHLYFPGFMPYICNPNIHPIHSPYTVSLFGWYINTHSRALPTTLHLLAPRVFCWPPPPQWPLHPVRGSCCRIMLSLLRSELCSPPITMTGEVTLMRGYLTTPPPLLAHVIPTVFVTHNFYLMYISNMVLTLYKLN